MCFSATASFSASAILLPVGIYCVKKALDYDKRFLMIAVVPFLFGIQQIFEGGLWRSIDNLGGSAAISMALAFLFFADFIWPFLIPLATAFIEDNKRKRQVFFIFSVIGGIYGLSLYLPLLVNEKWMSIQLIHGSIFYQLIYIYDAIIPRIGIRSIYVIIVTIPLLVSSLKSMQFLGILLLISIIVSTLFFSYAFVSVWCFFAAIISVYIFWVMRHCIPVEKH